MHRAGSWTKHHPPASQRPYAQQQFRQAFRHPRTSIGAAGHWIHLLSVTAPLVIPELIPGRDKQYKALRLTSVGAALASEAVWTLKLMHDRQREQECRASAAETGAER